MERGRWHRVLGPSSLPLCLQLSAGTARRFPTFQVSRSCLVVSCQCSEECFCMELPGPQPPHSWATIGTCSDLCLPRAAEVTSKLARCSDYQVQSVQFGMPLAGPLTMHYICGLLSSLAVLLNGPQQLHSSSSTSAPVI